MKKFLLIQTAFPGDAILTLPAIQVLKKNNPDAQIDVVCIPQTEEIFRHSISVSETIIFDKKKAHRKFSSLKKFASELRGNNYDAVYSFHRSARTAMLVYFIGAKESYGFETSTLNFLYKNEIRYDYKKHEVERNLALVSEEKFEKLPLPQIESSNEVKERIQNFLAEKKLRNFLAIAPGSVWETKKYPAEKFQEVVKWCSEKNISVCLIGSKNEFELCTKILGETTNVLNSAGLFSIVETVELLRHASVLITNDSAPTHMAMAANIPVLTIYCSTVPEFGFYPYNEKSSFVSLQGISCKPCGVHGYDYCPLGHFKCGNDLPSNKVIYELEKLLNDTGRN